jgi:hypothetical protein
MANSNKRRHSIICDTCKGNGYVKIIHLDDVSIHQCWVCESEGELYVDESEIVESYINAHNSPTNDKSKLN